MTTTATTSAWVRVRPDRRPTERQLSFLADLLGQREALETARPLVTQYEAAVTTGNLSRPVVSGLITALLAIPVTRVVTASSAPSPVAVEVEEGFYTTTAAAGTVTVWKVQRAVHGSGRLYAKVLREQQRAWPNDGEVSWKFEYQTGGLSLIARGLRDGNIEPLTLERAQEIGHLYGICCICSATLTDEVSIENGIGPVCARRFGGREAFGASRGRVPTTPHPQISGRVTLNPEVALHHRPQAPLAPLSQVDGAMVQ